MRYVQADGSPGAKRRRSDSSDLPYIAIDVHHSIRPGGHPNLGTTLDNVLDSIEDATFRIAAYRLDPIPEPAVELGRMVNESCRALSRALAALRDRKPVWDDCIEVNRLENEADAVERTVVGKLFSSQMDPIALIKQKEVFEILENTTDFCEDVADVIQNVAVKNS